MKVTHPCLNRLKYIVFDNKCISTISRKKQYYFSCLFFLINLHEYQNSRSPRSSVTHHIIKQLHVPTKSISSYNLELAVARLRARVYIFFLHADMPFTA